MFGPHSNIFCVVFVDLLRLLFLLFNRSWRASWSRRKRSLIIYALHSMAFSQCFAMIYAIVRPRSNRISTHFSISSNKWASQVANFEDIRGSTNRVYRKCIRPTSWRWACLTQISSDHETIFTIYHVRIHVHLSSMIVFLGL